MSRTADQDLRRLWAIGNTLKNRVFAGKSLWDHLWITMMLAGASWSLDIKHSIP